MAKQSKYNKRPNKTTDYKILTNDHFNNEKELVGYIVNNIEYFCDHAIGCDYDRHILEFSFDKKIELFDNSLRVDIVIIDKEGVHYFIEVKKPRKKTDCYREVMTAIGQCLSYHYLARVYNYNYGGVFLVTSGHTGLAPLIIRDNNLPISYIYMDRQTIGRSLTFQE